jgi:hypothetical protein
MSPPLVRALFALDSQPKSLVHGFVRLIRLVRAQPAEAPGGCELSELGEESCGARALAREQSASKVRTKRKPGVQRRAAGPADFGVAVPRGTQVRRCVQCSEWVAYVGITLVDVPADCVRVSGWPSHDERYVGLTLRPCVGGRHRLRCRPEHPERPDVMLGYWRSDPPESERPAAANPNADRDRGRIPRAAHASDANPRVTTGGSR